MPRAKAKSAKAKTSKSKAIVVSTFAALSPETVPSGRLSPEELKESMGKSQPSISDLDRIKVPAGGSTMWEIPGADDEPDNVRSFEAVIVAAQDVRIFYATKYSGGNEPPDCISLDMVTGMVGEDCPEDVTGECGSCPKAQWGTATNDKGQPTKGKACSERKQLLVFREGDISPIFMSIPPTSLPEVQGYFRRLAGTLGEAHYSVVTKFTLRKEKNDSGITYSQVGCEMVRPLSDPELEASKRLRISLVPAVEKSPETASE